MRPIISPGPDFFLSVIFGTFLPEPEFPEDPLDPLDPADPETPDEPDTETFPPDVAVVV